MLLKLVNLSVVTSLWFVSVNLGGCSAQVGENPAYTVSNASIRVPAPGRTMTAGYFEFTNNSEEAVTIIAVRSSAAERVEMHTVLKVDDQMRMRPLPKLAVPAGDSAIFTSGGNHLMLFGVELSDTPTILEIELDNGTIVSAPLQSTALNQTN